jgi:hypothetical protein
MNSLKVGKTLMHPEISSKSREVPNSRGNAVLEFLDKLIANLI